MGLYDEYKDCGKCKEPRHIREFANNPREKDGLNYWCKPCMREYSKTYRRTPKGKEQSTKDKRASTLRSYKITVIEYNRLLKLQENKCAICKKPNQLLKNFPIDHNHMTGKIRGLLCFKCNIGLGHFNEDVELLQAAINYLNEHNQNRDSKYPVP